MAQPAYDVVGGFKYNSGPFQVMEFTTDQVVYQNGPVLLSANKKVRPWDGVSKVLGVAQHYAGIGEKVIVSVDPETLYEVTDYQEVTIDKIGKFVICPVENDLTRVGRYSSMKTVSSAATTTFSYSFPFQIVGLAKNVTNISSNCKCIVKIGTGEFEPYVDAV